MVTCIICSRTFKNGGVLARHIIYEHRRTYREYYHQYILKTDDIPKCKCGCGIDVTWNGMKYVRFIKGHQSRVHNNWGHNPKAIEKSTETRRLQYASGERTQWNKGLTKENNESIRIYGEKTSKRFTPEIRKEYSIKMSKNRLNGTIPTLHGSQHSQWKGGVSEINVLARARVRLYDEWKYPILVRDGFKCVECGSVEKLHIHHDQEQMCEIVKRHIVDDIEPRTFDEKEKIADLVVEYHIKNKVSGVTLCGKCHENKHPSLNFG